LKGGHRSYDAMKYKAMDDGEYRCVGYTEGKRGKEKGKLMWVFETGDGV
jgi:hypothetical protein